ncbi:extracellular serine/threonine protein kinase four-jointed [Contarinia nasturtii]|uniref:extracellular serine/threonine protein kinase four-jointed n=1 Tax=Contarinia nasturtii TaxID=265458 RepID=UPI0012D3DB65|nr:extracellular serine/threonine protein kinase four-jointed [Contarinia nasturtii]
MYDPRSIETSENGKEDNVIVLQKMYRRRNFQRQACVISVMAAFVIGLSLGVFVPVIGLGTAISTEFNDRQLLSSRSLSNFDVNGKAIADVDIVIDHTNDVHLSNVYNINGENDKLSDSYAVTFVTEGKRLTKHVNNKNDIDSINSDRFNDSNDHSLTAYLNRERTRKITSQRFADGKHVNAIISSFPFISTSLKRYNKANNKKYIHIDYTNGNDVLHNRSQMLPTTNINENPYDVIENNIFWGKIIEDALPMGYSVDHVNAWNDYVNKNAIVKLEIGCGRMQNRLVTFQDGRKACARYRQNTDQIQGELFSFYLGRLLNLTNLAPSAASIIDLNSNPWISAAQDVQSAQWKVQRPVVLTDWIPDLEAANIPVLFQPMERHLNKFDVKNITLGLDVKPPKTLMHHLGGIKPNPNWNQLPVKMDHTNNDIELNKTVQQKLVELAQWSDLIIFDYLIANLDRVVNNLYNFQWNADIMTAPAHNLARQSDSKLLVFLDNESGLLHGYRLLKKYETYHGLLINNLCVFRRRTIDALQKMQSDGIGRQLQQLFEQSTSDKVRDVLPSLPDKSIKILVDRIDRVLGQVQKCRELFSNR